MQSSVDKLYDVWYDVPHEVQLPKLKRLPAAFYQSSSGREPVKDWLHALDEKSKGNHIMTKHKGRVGSSFQDYLAEEGTLEETNAIAVKRVLAWQLEQAMERRQMSKSAMARAMRTSRSQLDRILDPDNDHIRLDTLTSAARVLDLSLRIELVG